MGSVERLRRFRQDLHGCFTAWPDALFELGDAVLCAPGPVGSIPSLSLEPEFRRSHGSLYKALTNGRIDEKQLRALLVGARDVDWPLVFAVDGSTWDRCDAECSPERGFYYSASKHSAGQPIVAGWSYQWVCQLNWAPDSWTAPMDIRRIAPSENTTGATIAQIRDLVGLLPTDQDIPLFVFDAGYDPIALAHELDAERCEIVCRIRDDRVFHADPPSRANRPLETGGRPPRHGPRFKCSDPATWPDPTATTTSTDNRYGTITITAWHGLHPRLNARGHWIDHDLLPIVKGTVIRVEVEHLPKASSRTKKTLWLFWSGPDMPDLDRVSRAYLRRFDIEHTFRFVKYHLGWTTPSVCTPEQADRWTWLTATALTQLRLAKTLITDQRLPWERPLAPDKLTPARARRGFRRLTPALGTPANPPKPSRAGPGRPKGTRRPPRTRHPALKKQTRQTKKV
jgi:DDE superfamily endonuclease